MLLLPLILWWAHAPLRIAQGKLRVAIAAFVIVTIAISSGSAKLSAEDRFQYGQRKANEQQHHLVLEESDDQHLLREGTTIPPTAGRIVMLGRRWAFVPAGTEKRDMNVNELTRRHISRRSVVAFRSRASATKPRPTRLGMSSEKSLRETRLAAAMALPIEEEDQSTHLDLPQMMLAENLMLERIVQAIRADAADDRWSVSGEVTEFFGENRFIIRTAQRASSR